MALDISNRNPEYYENRFEQRYKMACKCMVQIDGEQFNGEIADISFNGVAFILEHYWGQDVVGDTIEFCIFRENYMAVTMIGELRNCTVTTDNHTRIGLQIKRGNRQVWDALVRQAQNGL